MSSSQSSARGVLLQQRSQTGRDRLDRRERVVQLVSKHANQPLPRLQFFFAQRAGQVGDHEQADAAVRLRGNALRLTPQRPLAPRKVRCTVRVRLAGRNSSRPRSAAGRFTTRSAGMPDQTLARAD